MVRKIKKIGMEKLKNYRISITTFPSVEIEKLYEGRKKNTILKMKKKNIYKNPNSKTPILIQRIRTNDANIAPSIP